MKIRRRSRPGTAPKPTFLHDLRRGEAVCTMCDGKRLHEGPAPPRKAVTLSIPETPPPTRLPQKPSPFMKIRRHSRPGTAPNPTFLHDLRREVAVCTMWDGKRQHEGPAPRKTATLAMPEKPSLFMKIRRRPGPRTAPTPTFLHDVGRGGKVGRREWDGERGPRNAGRGKRDGESSMKGPRLPGEARAPFL